MDNSKPQKLKMGNNPEEKLEFFSNRETLVYRCSNQTRWSGLNLDLRFILCDVQFESTTLKYFTMAMFLMESRSEAGREGH